MHGSLAMCAVQGAQHFLPPLLTSIPLVPLRNTFTGRARSLGLRDRQGTEPERQKERKEVKTRKI